jgi:hypothetical protein
MIQSVTATLRAAWRAPRFHAAALLLTAFAWGACGGGGGGGGGNPPTQPPPTAQIQFTAAGSGSVFLARGAATTADTLQLEVQVTQVTGLYGLSFDLGYPAALFDYVGFTAGDFFAGGAGDPSVQVAEGPDGNLIVGATLLGAQPGISGTGLVLTIQLQAVAGGSGALTFNNAEGFDAGGNGLLGLSFAGGTVQVVR